MAVELVLGALGLAGLFSVTLEVWEFVDRGLECAQNFSLLRTKLDNQRVLFMIWAEQMGFGSEGGYHAQLDGDIIRPALERTLSHIVRLFMDTTALTQKYGIYIHQDAQASFQQRLTNPLKGIFRPRYRRFMAKVDRLKQDTTDTNCSIARIEIENDSRTPSPLESFLNGLRQDQENIPLWIVTAWSIKDEKKFNKMVQDLRDLVADLKDITKDFISLQKQQELAHESIQEITEQDLFEVEEAEDDRQTVLSSAASVRLLEIETSTISTGRETFFTAKTKQSNVSNLFAVPEYEDFTQSDFNSMSPRSDFNSDLDYPSPSGMLDVADDDSHLPTSSPEDAPTSPRIYMCDECNKSFEQIYRLNHHKRYHERKYECIVSGCGKKFGTKTHLDRHIIDKHKKTRKFYCTEPTCPYSIQGGKSFPRKDNWVRHIQKKHRNLSVSHLEAMGVAVDEEAGTLQGVSGPSGMGQPAPPQMPLGPMATNMGMGGMVSCSMCGGGSGASSGGPCVTLI